MLYLAMIDIIKKWTDCRKNRGKIHFRPKFFFDRRILTNRNL